MYKHGDQVTTNQAYDDRFGRKVFGTVVEHSTLPNNGHTTLVRWDKQIGNIIPDHQNNVVLMLTKDLELLNN